MYDYDVCLLILLFAISLLYIFKSKKEHFESNPVKDLDYRSKDILDIDSGNGIYKNYIPQGFSF